MLAGGYEGAWGILWRRRGPIPRAYLVALNSFDPRVGVKRQWMLASMRVFICTFRKRVALPGHVGDRRIRPQGNRKEKHEPIKDALSVQTNRRRVEATRESVRTTAEQTA